MIIEIEAFDSSSSKYIPYVLTTRLVIGHEDFHLVIGHEAH